MDNDYKKVCALCEHAKRLCGGDEMLCRKKGVVAEDFHCAGFSFDPLKRVPLPRPAFPGLDFGEDGK